MNSSQHEFFVQFSPMSKFKISFSAKLYFRAFMLPLHQPFIHPTFNRCFGAAIMQSTKINKIFRHKSIQQ